MITLVNPTLPYGFAKRCGVILLDAGDIAVVGLRTGADPAGLLEARRALGRPLQVQHLTPAEFDRRLSEVYAGDHLNATGGDDMGVPGGLDSLIDDIPAAADLLDTVRMRIDGVLRETLSLNPRITPLLVSRVKVMARLDIAEKRVPQDGRIPLTLGGKTLDVRVSTLPSRAGERVVLRILDKDQADLRLEDLGMGPDTLAAYRAALAEPNGVILVTGPTGSGKTTSLYAGLTLLNDATRNILTVEDPVEYAIHGVGQTQVNAKVGMTFAAGLRAILRQGPDVVMVGEIRDVETAGVAVQAALTGHLVLSTVHTNDAVGAVTRLRDMGIEPFLLASTLRLIVAQRLVRRLCSECRTEEAADAPTARLLGVKAGRKIWRAGACAHCNQTGYVGRVGLYETLRVDDRVRGLIAAEAGEDAIAAAAFSKGGALTDRARTLVLEGVTTVEEAVRVTRQDVLGEEVAA